MRSLYVHKLNLDHLLYPRAYKVASEVTVVQLAYLPSLQMSHPQPENPTAPQSNAAMGKGGGREPSPDYISGHKSKPQVADQAWHKR